MSEVPFFREAGDGEPGPDRSECGPGNNQLVNQPAYSRATGTDGESGDARREGGSTGHDDAGPGVPNVEHLRGLLMQLTMGTVTSRVSPSVSRVVGVHLNALINSDASMRTPGSSSAATSGSTPGEGSGGHTGDHSQSALSDKEIDELLDVVLSCNPSAVNVLERFLKPSHVERVRKFFQGQA
jgi:hypothetical protein